MEKMNLILVYEGLREKFVGILQKLKINSYTELPDVLGSGMSSGHHHGDDVWPRRNVMFLIALSPIQQEEFEGEFAGFREEYKNDGAKLFRFELEKII
ncbi:MAG: hypothetical protein PHW04_08560 [Candidatus Wallbacteria bacterium]|nr:hypothetical protein [Candidatus Wallbacteria bacterium]